MGTIPKNIDMNLSNFTETEDIHFQVPTSLSVQSICQDRTSQPKFILASYLPYHCPELINAAWIHFTIAQALKSLKIHLDQFSTKIKHHTESFRNQLHHLQKFPQSTIHGSLLTYQSSRFNAGS